MIEWTKGKRESCFVHHNDCRLDVWEMPYNQWHWTVERDGIYIAGANNNGAAGRIGVSLDDACELAIKASEAWNE